MSGLNRLESLAFEKFCALVLRNPGFYKFHPQCCCGKKTVLWSPRTLFACANSQRRTDE